MPMWALIWLVLLTGLLLSHIYMNIREINSNWEFVIKGDGTANRALRAITVRIEDGVEDDDVDEDTIKCTVFSRFNGDAFPVTLSLGKEQTKDNFALDATGSKLSLKGAGLTGNLVAIISGELVWNNSGTSIELVSIDEGGVGDADIMITFFSDASGTKFDLTAELSEAGKSINYDVLYITDA